MHYTAVGFYFKMNCLSFSQQRYAFFCSSYCRLIYQKTISLSSLKAHFFLQIFSKNAINLKVPSQSETDKAREQDKAERNSETSTPAGFPVCYRKMAHRRPSILAGYARTFENKRQNQWVWESSQTTHDVQINHSSFWKRASEWRQARREARSVAVE